MHKKSNIIFLILLGILLVVALGFNCKLRVKEALTKPTAQNKTNEKREKEKISKNKTKTESYQNCADYNGDIVAVSAPGQANYTPTYQNIEGMINLGRKKEPSPSEGMSSNGDKTSTLQGSNIDALKKKKVDV